jgi:RNA polymerase sigma factor (sigma-70 family)
MSGPTDGVDVAAQFRPGDPRGNSDLPLRASVEDRARVADLLRRIDQGDGVAWDEIFRRYGKLVSTTVRSFRLQEADTLDAVQMTWLRLTENAHRVQYPERLGGWLATTARRECLRILRQAKPCVHVVDMTPETVTNPSVDPQPHAIDADTARTLRKLIAELSSGRHPLGWVFFTDHPLSYAEVGHAAGIPPGAIGPTRARALRQLREKLCEYELEPGNVAQGIEEEPTEGDRTGSFLLDDLLDKADQGLREKLEPTVTDFGTGSLQGTADAQLDDLLHRADTALRASLRSGHSRWV